MVPFSRLLAALAEVSDPRRAQGKRYPLPYLLLFTVLALLSGAESYRGIIIFLDQRLDLLNDYFGVTLKRAPALNTLRNLLQSLDAAALESAFRLGQDAQHDAAYPREEPSAGKPHARICEGESRMAELLDHDPGGWGQEARCGG